MSIATRDPSTPAAGAGQNVGRTVLGLLAAWGAASLVPDAPPETKAAVAAAMLGVATTLLAVVGKWGRDKDIALPF